MNPTPVMLRALCVAALLAVAAPLAAQSLNDTVRRVERETGGRILSAETVTFGSREVYRIKVLTPDGRVRVVQEPVPAGRASAPRSREAPRRDERLDRNERSEVLREPPAAFAPRERGYVPRRERAEASQRQPPARDAQAPRERRDRLRREGRDDE